MTVGDFYRYMQHHAEQMRKFVPNPSEETLLAWSLEDQRRAMAMRYYEKQEAAARAKAEADAVDDYEIHITSEVKVK